MKRWLTIVAGLAAGAGLGVVACEQAGAQEGTLLIVPNGVSDNVRVYTLDAGGGLTLTSITGVGNSPEQVAVRGDQAFAYASFNLDNALAVIDTRTNTVVQTVAAGAGPRGVAVSPDGTRVYVANNAGGVNTVSVFTADANSGQLTPMTTIATGGNTQPRRLAVSPDGSRLFIANQGNLGANGSVAIVDTATNTIITTIATGGQLTDIAVNPAGTRAYVTSTTNQVFVIDTTTSSVVATVATGGDSRGVVVSADGTRFYVTNQNTGSIAQFDAATNASLGTIAAGTTPFGIVRSPNGEFVYTANNTSNNISIYSVGMGGLLNSLGTIAAGTSPTYPGICGNGNALLGTGSTFRANNGGAVACTMTGPGTGPIFTGGTMQIADANVSSTLPIFLAAQGGTIDTLANTATFSGVVSGPGALAKMGIGTLVLSGHNVYSGATLLNQGTLRAGAAGTFSPDSAVNVAAGAALDLAGFDQTIGSLAGTGSVLLGAGDLTSGGDGTSTTFSGAISGSGGLSKAGAGIFTLTGTSTYSGLTSTNQGTLVVNGSVANSVVSVLAGARLMGSGTLGGLVLAGTLAPGNSIGTLSVIGNATFGAGSIYEVEINPAGESDLLAATGTVTIAGGHVVVLNVPGAYPLGTTYTIVTAGGGVTGTFASVTDSLPLLDAVLSYLPTSVMLTLRGNAFPIASLGVTANQRATGAGIDSLGGGALENALSTLGAPEIPAALDLLSGEIRASIKSAFIEESRYLREAPMNRVRAAFGAVGARPLPVLGYAQGDGPSPAPADAPLAAWGEVLGAWGSFDGDGNAARFDRSIGGFLTGVDALVWDNVRLGLIGGYSHSNFDVDDRASSGSANSGHLGAYGGAQFGTVGLRAGAAYSWHSIDTSRTVAFGSFAETLDADYDAGTAQVFGEAGYRIDTRRAAFEPFANLAYVNLHTDGFTESGGAAALTHASDNTDRTFLTLGIRASMPVSFGTGEASLSGMIGWRHAFDDVTPGAAFAFSGGAPFLIAGTPIARDALALEAGFDVRLNERSSLGISYSGQIGGGAQDHSARARLTIGF